MTKRNGIRIRRIGQASIVFLVFLLFGCGSEPDSKPAQPVSAQAIAAGNVENGRDLFMGNHHFENDGLPCMGCHNVGENGLLGGGAMGPDLTNVSTRRSQAEILEILSNAGPSLSPVMQPIYMDFPLTAEEQADLVVFLESSVGQPESDKELIVLAISLAGFIVAVALLGFVYRGRLRSVRRTLVGNALKNQK